MCSECLGLYWWGVQPWKVNFDGTPHFSSCVAQPSERELETLYAFRPVDKFEKKRRNRFYGS